MQHNQRDGFLQMSKRRVPLVARIIGFFVVVAVCAAILIGWTPDVASKEAPATITLNFGLTRSDLSRTSPVTICRGSRDEGWPSRQFPECSKQTGDLTAPDPIIPSITSTVVVADLGQAGAVDPQTKACTPQSSGPQFPAAQLTAAATNGPPGELSLVVSAKPNAPELVPYGTYCGTIVINRTYQTKEEPAQTLSSPPVAVAVTVSLANREQGPVLTRVIAALLLGASAGWVMKWIADNLGTLGTARRTLDRLTGAAGVTLQFLPIQLRTNALELREAINQGDATLAADRTAIFTALDSKWGALSGWIATTRSLHDASQRLQAEAEARSPDLDMLRPAAVVLMETANSRLVSDAEFTEANPVDEQRRKAGEDLVRLARRYRGPADKAILTAIHSEVAKLTPPPLVPDSIAQAPEIPPASSPTLSAWLLRWAIDHRVAVLGGLTTIVAVAVGFTTQFLDRPAFADSLANYAALFGWAFALQVAGTTLAEMAGKLSARAPQ